MEENILDESRRIIDEADKEMRAAFIKRMEAVNRIAAYKAANSLPVYDEKREKELISKRLAEISNESPELIPFYRDFLVSNISLSRKYQKKLISSVSSENDIISVDTCGGTYDIIVKRGAALDIGRYIGTERRAFIVADGNVPLKYLDALKNVFRNPVVTVFENVTESTKSLASYEFLAEKAASAGITRTDCAVALGGGVTGDLTGFFASTYMRGIDFYNIPTTLLSQVDSSVGGKTGVDLGEIKNTLGTFYQPKKVLIDPDILASLDARQISSGLAEIIKMSLIADAELFKALSEYDFLNASELISDDFLLSVIKRSVIIKKKFVEEDERDSSVRKALNFGHTIGHAVEGLSGGKLLHGECVALGMIPMCSKEVREKLIPVLKKYSLPTSYLYKNEDIMKLVLHDKKSSGKMISAVFVDEIGKYSLREMTFDEISGLLD